MKHPMEHVEEADANPRLYPQAGAARYPDIDATERARAERSADIYGAGYLVLVDGIWRSFCGEEVRVIRKGQQS